MSSENENAGLPDIPVDIPPPPCRNPRGTWWGPPTTDPPEPPAAPPEPQRRKRTGPPRPIPTPLPLRYPVTAVVAIADKLNAQGDIVTEEALKAAAAANNELTYNKEDKTLVWHGTLPMPEGKVLTMADRPERKATFLTEGQQSKGGQNPPLEPGFKRPDPPGGSGEVCCCEIPVDAATAEVCQACGKPLEPPKTHKAATCYVDLDTIAVMWRLPEGVRVNGVMQTIYGVVGDRRHNQCMLHLEGDGLPDDCRVASGDEILCVEPKLKVNREGVVEFAGWE